MEIINKEQKKRLEIHFVGDAGWEKVREITVLKMMEAKTEEEFAKVLELLMSAMFKTEQEMDETRKKCKMKMINDAERKQIREVLDGK